VKRMVLTHNRCVGCCMVFVCIGAGIVQDYRSLSTQALGNRCGLKHKGNQAQMSLSNLHSDPCPPLHALSTQFDSAPADTCCQVPWMIIFQGVSQLRNCWQVLRP